MRRLRLLASALAVLGLPCVAFAAPKHASKHASPAHNSGHPTEVKLKPSSAAADEPAAGPQGGPPTRGPTRIDFDDRLIQGQTNKSGAVYLYDRKELKTRSMVKKRESFRDEIITSVFDT
jgi:hypothetical protein